jgi:hypothetical protein
MQRLLAVRLKINCNAVRDPLVYAQTRTMPRPSSMHTFLGQPPLEGSDFNLMSLVSNGV